MTSPLPCWRVYYPNGWHFYNRINGLRFDFTASQFAHCIEHQDHLSSFEEALSDTTMEQYNILQEAVEAWLMESDQDGTRE